MNKKCFQKIFTVNITVHLKAPRNELLKDFNEVKEQKNVIVAVLHKKLPASAVLEPKLTISRRSVR